MVNTLNYNLCKYTDLFFFNAYLRRKLANNVAVYIFIVPVAVPAFLVGAVHALSISRCAYSAHGTERGMGCIACDYVGQ
jgi:hypothetical protein